MGLIHAYGKAWPVNTSCPHITPHQPINIKTVRGHFVNDHRKVMLRFQVFTQFIHMFTFEKISVRRVSHSFFMDIPVHKFPSRFTIYLLYYSDACVGILYNFVLMMQTHSLAFWVLTAIRYITNIVLFFLFNACPFCYLQ